MKVVDLNLLIYAVNVDAPEHSTARRWWEGALSGEEQVGLAWPVVLGFLRLTTRRGVLPKPIALGDALDTVQQWIEHPLVTMIGPGDRHWGVLRGLLEKRGTAGNLTTDAHLASLAIELGATVYTTDADYEQLPGTRFVNPLAEAP